MLKDIIITSDFRTAIILFLPDDKLKSLASPLFHRKLNNFFQKELVLFVSVTIFFLCPVIKVFSQKASDSLVNAVNISRGTKKVDALNNLAEYTLRFSITDAQKLLEQAQQISENLKYKFGKAKSFQLLANLFGNKGENQLAIKYAEKAERMFLEMHEYELQFNCLITQGSNYNALGNNSREIVYYLKALHLAEKLRRTDLQSYAASYLSQSFIKLDDNTNTLEYASKALLLSRRIKNQKTIGLANIAMGNYLSKFGDPQNAKIYFRVAIKALSNSKNLFSVSSGYCQFGHHFIKTNEYDSALFYYNKALKINMELNEVMTQASVLTFIAHIYQLKTEYNKALLYQEEALQLRKHYGNLWLTGSSYCNIGTVYSKLEDYKNALQHFQAGLRIARVINRIDYIKFTYQRIYDLYVSQKNFKKALDINMLISRINDSILRNDIQQRFVEIKTKHDNEQKQRAIVFLTKENEIQKLRLKQTNLTIYVMAVALFLIIIIGVLLMIQVRLKSRQKQMDIEQNLLRSQMNPHFIFNALVAIQSFIYKKDSKEAAHYLTNFARLIRLVLSDSQEEFVTLKREIDTLSNYLSLQKLRFEDKFDYSLVVDINHNSELIKIPPMLAQPFIENAIEHGIFGKDSPGRIDINFSLINNLVLIEITDNGVGRQRGKELRKKSDKSHESYGTRITEERIHSHNRKYGHKLELHITDLFDSDNKPTGTKVLLSIPNHGI
jgi:sensor histidine kinase YesM